LRFSLVNENETQPAYFDYFEITHKPNPQKLTVTSWAEYYAFGKVAKASCPSSGSYRYGYQGEFAEKDQETDWNSFELRQYDSEIGRWLSVDPYQQYWSPYVGMGNDPVNQIDPDGGESGGGGGNITPRGYQPLSPSGNVCPPDIKMMPGAGGGGAIPPPPPVTSFADRAAAWMAAAASRVTPFMGGAAAFAGAMLMSHPAGSDIETQWQRDQADRERKKEDDIIRVRHYTSKENLIKIQLSMRIDPGGKASPFGVDVELPPFGNVNTVMKELGSQGNAYVEFSVHRSLVIPIPGTGTATHPNRHTGRIPLGITPKDALSNPLFLHDKKPKFVGAEWWRF
jgi:RHS repeat-associated protein